MNPTVSTTPNESAAALLNRTWAGQGFPVDPVRIAKKLGLDVMVAELPINVSGAIVKDLGRDPVILLATEDSPARQRFTCAHELGHYVYRQQMDGECYEYIDMRGPESRTGKSPEERFANQFAAALLMPAEAVKVEFELEPVIATLAYKFGVSGEAMTIRLRSLQLT